MTSAPEPLGRWSDTAGSSRTFPELGARYRVTREFTDHDGDVHRPGEEWTFLGSNFLPYHSGWSFIISFDDQQEAILPLQDMPEAQGEVLRELETYITAIGPSAVGQQVREKIQQIIAKETAASAAAARRSEADDNWSRALPWLFIAFGPFAVMTLYYELSRKLGLSVGGTREWIVFAIAVFAGAFALWWKTRPSSILWLILYVPAASLFLIILIAASVSPH